MNTPPEKSFSVSKKVSTAKKEKGILQRIFLEGVPPERSGGGRARSNGIALRRKSHHASGAYVRVQSHHARDACEVSHFVTENMFGFHHIDGASEIKYQDKSWHFISLAPAVRQAFRRSLRRK